MAPTSRRSMSMARSRIIQATPTTTATPTPSNTNKGLPYIEPKGKWELFQANIRTAERKVLHLLKNGVRFQTKFSRAPPIDPSTACDDSNTQGQGHHGQEAETFLQGLWHTLFLPSLSGALLLTTFILLCQSFRRGWTSGWGMSMSLSMFILKLLLLFFLLGLLLHQLFGRGRGHDPDPDGIVPVATRETTKVYEMKRGADGWHRIVWEEEEEQEQGPQKVLPEETPTPKAASKGRRFLRIFLGLLATFLLIILLPNLCEVLQSQKKYYLLKFLTAFLGTAGLLHLIYFGCFLEAYLRGQALPSFLPKKGLRRGQLLTVRVSPTKEKRFQDHPILPLISFIIVGILLAFVFTQPEPEPTIVTYHYEYAVYQIHDRAMFSLFPLYLG